MEYIKVLLPSVVVGLLFWYVLRAILRSDSTERREMDRYYQQLDAHDNEHEPTVDERKEAESGAQSAPAGSTSRSPLHDDSVKGRGTHGTRNQDRSD